MRKLILGVMVLLCCHLVAQEGDLTGFWLTMDDNMDKPTSVVAVYPYQDKYYARIIGSFNGQGQIDDSIYQPRGRAPGIEGNPYYSGLDFVFDACYEGAGRFAGYVIDPRDGKTYDAELWRSGANLILRGELFTFGESKTWRPCPDTVFNATFKKPDLSTFIPVIPQTVRPE